MKLKIAQIQSHVYADVQKNLEQLEACLKEVSFRQVDLVCVGEMFACPYQTGLFPVYAQKEGGPTWQYLSTLAKKYGVILSAGSVPERDEDGRIYNTAYVFDAQGKQIARHRKVHLFDINVRGGQAFRESATLTAGNTATVFDTKFGKMGLCICFDCRFPELVRKMVLDGAKVILVPAAFNRTTGPAHWELMFRSRAVDNQCYMVGTSPAGDEKASYVAWGHSLVVSPWGDVIGELDEKPGVLVSELELELVEEIREQLPLLSARHPEAYGGIG